MHPALQAILLLPVLLVQGLWVATRVVRLPEAAGPRKWSGGQGPPLRVLILGDSSAAGVGAQTQDQALMGHLGAALARDFSVHIDLVARSGITTAKARQLLNEAAVPACDAAVVCLGVNDTKNGVLAKEWRTETAGVLADLRAKGARHITFCGLPPIGEFPLLPWPLRASLGARAAYFDRLLSQVTEQDPVASHLPTVFEMDPSRMAKDGFHPGPSIYAEWGEVLAARIRADRAQDSS